MRKHSGMRPHDIVILLKIISFGDKNWQMKDLANSLFISPSEISESLNRSKLSGLLDYNKKKINRQNLLDFLEYGFKYVFPVQPGGQASGFATAHSHPFMREHISSDLMYVWPDSDGEIRGLSIEPLYPKQVKAILIDQTLYKLLALLDVIRVGRVREIKIAREELKKIIKNG